MKLESFPFMALNWSTVPREERKGDEGCAYWQTHMMNDIRVRMVEYSPGYRADHWCEKGHILTCLEGEMETTLSDGRKMILSAGTSYFVGDNNEPHRSSTQTGCKLLIVD